MANFVNEQNRTPRSPGLNSVRHISGLDGLRAVAVIAVMIYHANSSWLPGGFLGVEVFFVISGYLITLLLLAEHEQSGQINVRAFWGRRARRLLPALGLLMAFVAVAALIAQPSTLGRVRGDVIAGALYGSNWFQLWVGAGYASSGDFAPLRHLWSLAVEEQFYVIWPLVVVALLRRRAGRLGSIILTFVLTAVGITLVMGLLAHSGPIGECSVTPDAYWTIGGRCFSKADVLYLATPLRASGLLLGAALAVVWRPATVMRSRLRHRPGRLDVLAVLGLLALVVMMFRLHFLMSDPDGAGMVADVRLFRGGFVWTDVATLAVIVAVVHRYSTVGRVLSMRPLQWVGTRSYGLYLYHWPIYQVLRKVAGVSLGLPKFVIAIVLAGGLAELSYRWVEMPIRRRDLGTVWQQWSSQATTAVRRGVAFGLVFTTLVVAFAAYRVATADLQLNTIEATIAAGEEQVTSVEELLGEVTTDDVDTVEPTPDLTEDTSATSIVATVTPQRDPVEFLALGDSVMLGAAGVLRERGYTVNAEKNRQLQTSLPFIQQLKDAGTFGDVIVIHLGTNGPISSTDLETLLDIVRDVPLVVMLNVRGDLEWKAANNALLASVDGPDDNLIVIDWEAESKNCSGACFAEDGVHLLDDGQTFYANAIRDVTGV